MRAMPDTSDELERKIADKVRRGVLPRTLADAWKPGPSGAAAPMIRFEAGRGTGEPCSVCDLPVTTTDRELVLTDGQQRVLRFHEACHRAWTGPPPASPGR